MNTLAPALLLGHSSDPASPVRRMQIAKIYLRDDYIDGRTGFAMPCSVMMTVNMAKERGRLMTIYCRVYFRVLLSYCGG